MPNHDHGTYNRFKNGPCDCGPCAEAGREYQRTRYRLMAYGQWEPFAEAEPVREHVRSVQAAGVSWRRLAKVAGVSTCTVSRLLYSDPPTTRLRIESARKLLAVAASRDLAGDSTPVDATGTRRRLQALTARGWAGTKLAPYLNLDATGVTRMLTAQRVHARKARAVAAMYEQLWDQAPPEETRADKAAATRARREAEANGWPTPLGWDDETIDDPDARPHAAAEWDDIDPVAVERAIAGEPVPLSPAEIDEVIRIGNAKGMSAMQIAAAAGRSTRAVQRRRAAACSQT